MKYHISFDEELLLHNKLDNALSVAFDDFIKAYNSFLSRLFKAILGQNFRKRSEYGKLKLNGTPMYSPRPFARISII